MISSVFLENIFTWMGNNLILAVIPLVLSFFIFQYSLWEKHNEANVVSIFFRVIHILAMLVFFVFLPNAPYTITDLIHLIRQIRDYKYFDLTDSQILYGLIPQYFIFIFLGMSCYTIAFRNFVVFMQFEKGNYRITKNYNSDFYGVWCIFGQKLSIQFMGYNIAFSFNAANFIHRDKKAKFLFLYNLFLCCNYHII